MSLHIPSLVRGLFAAHRHWGRTRAELLEWQRQRGIHHWSEIRNSLPFYSKWLEGRDSGDMLFAPPTDRSVMFENIQGSTEAARPGAELLRHAQQAEQSRDFSSLLDGKWILGLSSGTTGRQSLFVTSPREHAFYLGALFGKVPQFRPLRRQRIAFVLRAFSKLYEPSRLSKLELRYFDLKRPTEEWISELNLWQADTVIAPASVLLHLARDHKGWRARLESVISVAEVLEPWNREWLEKRLQVPVGEIYQAMEGFLGYRCERGSLHLNEDFIRFEYEPHGNDVYSVLVTDLYRRVQPLYRYKLGDLIRLDPAPCLCGSPTQVVREIIGRSGDVCWLDDKRPVFPDLIYRWMTEQVPGLQDFQWDRILDSSSSLRKLTIQVQTRSQMVPENLAGKLRQSWKLKEEIAIEVLPWSGQAPGPIKRRRVRVVRSL